MEHALALRMKHGVDAAADWLEEQGIPRELAVYSMVKARNAWRYGARPGIAWNRRGKTH